MKFANNKAKDGEGSTLSSAKPEVKPAKKQVKYFTLAEQKAKSGDGFDTSVDDEEAAEEKRKEMKEKEE